MTQSITIQISVYNWSIMEEFVYETQISSVGDFLALTYRFNKQVKYRKSTDKNWYYGKTMIKRLFKKDLNNGNPLKINTTIDLERVYKEKDEAQRKAQREEKAKREKELLEWVIHRKANIDFTMEQITTMSNLQFTHRLVELYNLKHSYCYEDEFNHYFGPFESYNEEIDYIEH
ncbi:hypothetical protein Q7A53_21135 [Halobacillus rhizosphaerae]|uniref:hypothetical protein n=1 Tax=Halobacillus rhizosphaerae TaxID=3064889 RepID=UPI00398ACBA6